MVVGQVGDGTVAAHIEILLGGEVGGDQPVRRRLRIQGITAPQDKVGFRAGEWCHMLAPKTHQRTAARIVTVPSVTSSHRQTASRPGRLSVADGSSLGSGLISYSQKMTVAARVTAEKKAVGQRS